MKKKYIIAIMCAFALIISANSYLSYGGNNEIKDICFDFVYPISFIMPDGSPIIVDNEDEWEKIKDWYTVNPDVKEKPVLQFPVDIILKDGTVKTIKNEDELKEVYEYCLDTDKTKYDDICFKFVYPITYTMPDGSIITIENIDDWDEIKDWYKVNPDVKEKPVLKFPVDIMFKDGTVKTVNNEDELKKAYEICWYWDKDDDNEDKDMPKCFDFIFPISYVMPDGLLIIVDSEDDWNEINEWYEVNSDVKEKPVLQFPVDIIFKDGTTRTINNEDELKEAYEDCWDKDDDDEDDDGDDDDDDNDDKSNQRRRLRNLLMDRLRAYIERLRVILRERQT